jgi:hypothetical protein
MITASDLPHGAARRAWSGAKRAFDGARRAVIPAYGIGALVGIVTGIPVVLCAGAGAIVGIGFGAVHALRQ